MSSPCVNTEILDIEVEFKFCNRKAIFERKNTLYRYRGNNFYSMNKLRISIIEQCLRFVKTGGKSDVKLVIPLQVSGVEGIRCTQRLTDDVVNLESKISENFFSSLEIKLINEIKGCKIENARVIDKSGNLAKDIEFIGDKYSIRLSPECAFKEGAMDKFVDSIYIHNHPLNAPLSSNDIYQMATLKIKKMVACTPDGGYSVMERIKPISEMNYSELINNAGKLISEEIQKMKQLGKIRGITDLQRMEMLNSWRYERFGSFAKEFGLEFKNSIKSSNSQEYLEGNIFRVNPLNRLIDNLIVRYRNLKT